MRLDLELLVACVRAKRAGKNQKLSATVPRLQGKGYSVPCSWKRHVVVGILTYQCPNT